MPAPISEETIALLYEAYESGMPITEAANAAGIGYSSASKYIRKKYTSEHIKSRGTSVGVRKNTNARRVDMNKVTEACHLFQYTVIPVSDIEKTLGITGRTMRKYVYPMFSKRFIQHRYNKLRNLLYERNTGSGNGAYSGGVIITKDARGLMYRAVLKPKWYKGPGFNKGAYVREHILVVCKSLGINKLPKGFVVHHCDGDTFNNAFDNLVLLPSNLHTALHQYLRKRATTISKESTLKWLGEARGFKWNSLEMI